MHLQMSPYALFVWLISHQPAVLFSHNKPAISNQTTVLFSQNKPAPPAQLTCCKLNGNEYLGFGVAKKIMVRANKEEDFGKECTMPY
jgi:hypothetical protein